MFFTQPGMDRAHETSLDLCRPELSQSVLLQLFSQNFDVLFRWLVAIQTV